MKVDKIIVAGTTGRVTKQAMSQLVRLMEQQGYLKQVPDPNHTRAKVVRMTRRREAVKTNCVEVSEELTRKLAEARELVWLGS